MSTNQRPPPNLTLPDGLVEGLGPSVVDIMDEIKKRENDAIADSDGAAAAMAAATAAAAMTASIAAAAQAEDAALEAAAAAAPKITPDEAKQRLVQAVAKMIDHLLAMSRLLGGCSSLPTKLSQLLRMEDAVTALKNALNTLDRETHLACIADVMEHLRSCEQAAKDQQRAQAENPSDSGAVRSLPAAVAEFLSQESQAWISPAASDSLASNREELRKKYEAARTAGATPNAWIMLHIEAINRLLALGVITEPVIRIAADTIGYVRTVGAIAKVPAEAEAAAAAAEAAVEADVADAASGAVDAAHVARKEHAAMTAQAALAASAEFATAAADMAAAMAVYAELQTLQFRQEQKQRRDALLQEEDDEIEPPPKRRK